MNIEFDYDKEKQKLDQEKLEWEKYKKEQQERFDKEKEILTNFQYSYNNEILYEGNRLKNIKYDVIKELQAEKLEYEQKIKEIQAQINSIEEERELFNNYQNECEQQLLTQLNEITNEKAEMEKKKIKIDEEFEKVRKREIDYISNEEKLTKKKQIINELINEVQQKEMKNKQQVKNISDEVKKFDLKNNEIKINKIKLKNKLNDIYIQKEQIGKEKKLVEAKKKDLLLKLESINLVGMKLYGNKLEEEQHSIQENI